MTFGFALFVVLVLFVKICSGITSTKYFTSSPCEKNALTISADDTYYLVWNGQIIPHLCNFTFESDWNIEEICFKSEVYDLYYLLYDVKIQIKHNDTSLWEYDKYDHKIQRTCLKTDNNLTISILVSSGYQAPSYKKYIELKITGTETDKDESDDGSVNIIYMVVFGIVVLVVFFCCSSKGKECRENNRDLPAGCIKALNDCAKCECIGKCESQSCDCQLQDVCKPCGECCSAWAQCCTTFIVRTRQVGNETSNGRTEVQETSNNSGRTQVALSEIAVTNITPETPDLPPSYEVATEMEMRIEPTAPPPSYAEVTGYR